MQVSIGLYAPCFNFITLSHSLCDEAFCQLWHASVTRYLHINSVENTNCCMMTFKGKHWSWVRQAYWLDTHVSLIVDAPSTVRRLCLYCAYSSSFRQFSTLTMMLSGNVDLFLSFPVGGGWGGVMAQIDSRNSESQNWR